MAAKAGVTVITDGATTYPGLVAKAMPAAEVKRAVKSSDGFDPLFRLNHICAKIRSDVANLARRTWATTKKRVRLQGRLDLFVAMHNGYTFC